MTIHVCRRNARDARINIMTWYGLREQNFECAVVECVNPYVEGAGDFDEGRWICGRDDCFSNEQEDVEYLLGEQADLAVKAQKENEGIG